MGLFDSRDKKDLGKLASKMNEATLQQDIKDIKEEADKLGYILIKTPMEVQIRKKK